jgi:hypothetical protein
VGLGSASLVTCSDDDEKLSHNSDGDDVFAPTVVFAMLEFLIFPRLLLFPLTNLCSADGAAADDDN